MNQKRISESMNNQRLTHLKNLYVRFENISKLQEKNKTTPMEQRIFNEVISFLELGGNRGEIFPNKEFEEGFRFAEKSIIEILRQALIYSKENNG